MKLNKSITAKDAKRCLDKLKVYLNESPTKRAQIQSSPLLSGQLQSLKKLASDLQIKDNKRMERNKRKKSK